MITEKETIKCEAVFNDDHTHRYLWKRVWNKDKPLICVLMLNPCLSDNIITDTTTTLVVNNVARLEKYGGVEIINLYSCLTTRLSFRWNSDSDLNDPENDDFIRKAANDCETVLLAWGRGMMTNQRFVDRVDTVLELLRPYAEKLFVLSDGFRTGLHPLTPLLRSRWLLEPFHYPDSQDSSEITSQEKTEGQE